MRCWLRRIGSQWRWLPVFWYGLKPATDGSRPVFLTHRHTWGPCKWNGQYWYARCIAYEWCTARIAC